MKKLNLKDGKIDYEAIAEEILERVKALQNFEESMYIAARFKGCELKVSQSSVKVIRMALGSDNEDEHFVHNLEKALLYRSGCPYEITDINVEDDGDMYVGLK